MSFDGLGKVGVDASALLATSFDGSEQGFDEAAARGALRAEGELSPDHRVTQSAFARIVGGFDPVVPQKDPQPLTMLVQFAAHALEEAVAALGTPQQQSFQATADRPHATDQRGARDCAVTVVGPVFEQATGPAPQVIAQPLGLCVAAVHQGLKVSFQMGPAPL